jgi:predicted permease
VEGQPVRPPGEVLPGLQFIDGNFFAAMGIPISQGRALAFRDSGAKPAAVAVISESVARRYWQDPKRAIGSVMHIGGYAFPPMTVVGMAGDVKDWFTGQGEETIYLANAQMPQRSMGLLLRTRIDPVKAAPAARRQLQSVDHNQPIYDIKSMEQLLDEQTSGVRLAAVMMGVFAIIALFLAVSGIYGVVAYSVAQRTQEIGVRMALGARAGNVRALVIGQALRLAALGLVIGVLVSYLAARLMSSMLYGVIDPDPYTFVGLAAILAASALLAGYFPARRATRIDPMVALRCE